MEIRLAVWDIIFETQFYPSSGFPQVPVLLTVLLMAGPGPAAFATVYHMAA